jgi:NAD(P)-dependent dehydrogenase (short-subunit alcohol dehydrogenase family)
MNPIARGVPFGSRSPRKRGPYCAPLHSRGMKCDVTSLDDVNAMVKATADAFGGISTLINNVGWGGR